jgi:hypothetical protein
VKRPLVLLGILWPFVVATGLGAAGNTSADPVTPVISEFLASNGSREPLGEGDLLDADGDSSDWIELYNPTPEPFDLGGWYLTDDAGQPARWRFPSPTVLAPNGYLLIFASDKDRTVGELHTNFKLAAESGYLALVMPDGRTVAFDYGPSYPPQRRDVSYGLGPQGVQYFAVPTPGRPNTSAPIDVVAGPRFSHEHGLYEDPFTLTLFCDTPGATLRYTTDGKPPTETGGQVYTAPIVIQTTTCIRAAAFKPGWLASEVRTRTFVFLADVARQSSKPPGFPAVWGSSLADYEMDPEILGELAPGQLAQALRSLPTMSIVMDGNDLFGAAGIYVNWSRTGDAWERPCSVELIEPDGSGGFQVDCGIRIHGGAGRLDPKKSFRLQFTSVYGPGKLQYPLFGPGAANRFDQLVLRGGFNDGYAFILGSEHAQFIRDEFVRRLQLALGHPSPHGTFVHLYINGLYWGLYNPIERPESSFAATYFGGDKDDWDTLASGRPVDGSTMTTWNAMLNLVRQGMMSNANYQRLQGNNPDGTRNPQYVNYLDLDNYIDYLLINFLVGNRDWPARSNWYAAMNRVEPTGWKSFSWDAEHSMGIDSNLTDNVTSINGSLGEPYAWLRVNPEFCLRSADRVQRAFGPGGPFYVDPGHPLRDPGHPEQNRPAALYAELAEQVEPAIVGESARWGDNKGIAVLRIDDWRRERDWVLNTYLPQRPGIVLGQLRDAGLYPMIDPPAFQVDGAPQHGGVIPPSGLLTMTAAAGATVYYTTDGTDPRTPAYVSGDSETVTLVPEDAPKRVLVPTVANGGNLLPNFTGGFEVTYYRANTSVDSLAAAEAVIANAALRATVAKQQARVINYANAGNPGHFDADRPFPGMTAPGDANDFVVLITGKVLIPEAGDWTLGVNSDGGFGLTLSSRGRTYTISYPGPRPAGDTLAAWNIAEPGLHELRLAFYGRGDAELEFFAAPGRFAAFSPADFRLVGDILSNQTQAQGGTLWFTDSFADASWRLGTGGVGFEQDAGDGPLFSTDVGADMYNVNGSCYIRIPFTLTAGSYASLLLNMRYDDGFIAYLNGTEVARRNFTGDPQWNSVATGAGDAAPAQTTIDLSDRMGLLRPGANLLAVHGLNAAMDSPGFLISVELVAGELGQGFVAPTAIPYTGPLSLKQGTRLKARAFDGAWSALNEAVFTSVSVAQSLRVSEIMYHPPDTGNPDDPNTEFLELTNIANENINLDLVRFTDGIDYTFPDFELPAGGYCLVVKDPVAFQAKYGAKLPVVGQYAGSLSNSGERLELVDAAGQVIQSFAYDDSWFKSTDGSGYSLVVRDPKASDLHGLNDEEAWRPSTAVGGSPGRGD